MDVGTIVLFVIFIVALIYQFLREQKHVNGRNSVSRKSTLREKTSIDYEQHEKSHSEYCVYHIKHSNHTLLMGYVGVSNNFDARKHQHILHLKKKCHVNYKLQKAWDNGVFNEDSIQILFSGLSRGEAYGKEANLRGRKNMGWNINKGGYS